MSKLIIVAGLPGSGKTHYLSKLKADKEVSFYYDDYQHKAYGLDHDPRLSRHFGPLLSKLKKNQQVAISDILFCQARYLNTFLYSVYSVLPEVQIELVFFENDSNKAISNIEKRNRQDFVAKELKFVKENSPSYSIPAIKTLKIHSSK